MSNNSNNSGGAGFLSLLTIVFITLKLTEVIDWSWWWVLAPLWGPASLFLAFALFACCMALLVKLADRRASRGFARMAKRRREGWGRTR